MIHKLATKILENMMKAGMNWMIMMNTIKKNPTKKVKDDEKAE